MLVEDSPDGHEADLLAQPAHEVGDPPVDPVGVVPADSHDGRASASGGACPMGVFVRFKLPVPVHERPRRPRMLVPLQLVGVEAVQHGRA